MIRRGAFVVAMALALGVGGAAHFARAASPELRVRGNFQLRAAKAFGEFPVYYLGESFAGLRLTRIYRIDDAAYPGEDVRRDDVTFVYGTCRPPHGGGCLPPLQVQSWTSCERHLRAYSYEPETATPVGGRTARAYEAGRRLEIAAGATTIVLYSGNARLLRRAAAALRRANTVREARPCRPEG